MLELVLALPIMLIALLAVIEFGIYFVNVQQVTLASRVGAEEASQTEGLLAYAGTTVPGNVVHMVDQQLQSSGIYLRRIRLEYVNEDNEVVELLDPDREDCPCPAPCTFATPPPGHYVRLSVCVPMKELMPNCLTLIGFDICDTSHVIQSTTTFRYEMD